MKVFRKIQKYVSVVVLFSLMLLMYNNIAYQHRHLLPNGQGVVHTHPFSKTNESCPEKKHTHNANEFFLISLINNLFSFVLLISFAFQFVQEISYSQFFDYIIEMYFSICKSYYYLRGPPLN